LLDLCDAADLSILNGLVNQGFDGEETFIGPSGSSVIDYFIISNDLCSDQYVLSLEVSDKCVESDHQPVTLVLKCSVVNAEPVKEQLSWVHKIVWDSDKEDTFRTAIQSSQIIEKLERARECVFQNSHEALNMLVDCLKECSSCMVKKVKHGSHRVGEKWFDSECFSKRKETRAALRKFKRSKTYENRQMFVNSRKAYKSMLKTRKQIYKSERAQMLANSAKKPKLFWKELRFSCGLMRKQSPKTDISPVQWRNHFMKVFCTSEVEQVAECPDINLNYLPSIDCLDAPITEEEVIRALRDLKNGKAGGPDEVLPEMLKAAGSSITKLLLELFNAIFESGEYPEPWSQAIIIPLHKKGDTRVPDNFRGISLLSIIGKCYTSILNKRLYYWLDLNDKISESQAGFRKGFSTTDHVFTLYAATQKCLSRTGSKLYVAFIDLRKAFDSVKRRTLLSAMIKCGISKKFVRAIMGIYKQVKSAVRTCDTVTELFDCPIGLRQGCVLSPTLFSVVINLVAENVTELGRHGIQFIPGLIELLLLLFADDIALISCSPVGLQCQLNVLHESCHQLDLTINTDKSKIMVFRHGGYLGRFEHWSVGEQELEVVNSYIYLGYKFTTAMSFNEAARHFASRGKKAVYGLLKAYSSLDQMTKDTYFKIFDTMVQPVMAYTSELWGLMVSKDPTEKVHLQACKRFAGVSLRSPNNIIYGELGRFPLRIIYSVKSVKYWLRLMTMEDKRLPKQAYKMLLNLDIKGKCNWVTQVRLLICQAGFGHVWIAQGVGNQAWFCAALKQRLLDMNLQDWRGALNSSDRYRLYRSFKDMLVSETYFLCVKQKCFRDALARIRVGVSSLRAHRNRFTGVNLQCPFCPEYTDDELHMLFVCKQYDHLRPLSLREVEAHNVRTKYASVMSNQSESHLRKISWFLFKCFQLRIDNGIE
jgi:hypothetical protein